MVIIDFDGTIIDVWNKYYRIFLDFWKVQGLSIETYIQYKRLLSRDEVLVKQLVGTCSQEIIEEYQAFKSAKLEDINYLRFDKVIADDKLLKSFIEKENSIVLTIRKNPLQYFRMLDYHGLNYLKPISVILEPRGNFSKRQWVEINISEKEPKWIIGDAETDMNIGLLNNTKVYFVDTGLRSVDTIEKSGVSFEKCSDINNALKLIENNNMVEIQ